MKNTYKAVLAVALGLTSAMTLKASSGYDMILGFTSGSGNDFMIDIGPAVNVPGYMTGFYNGQPWSLGSYLTGNLSPSSVSWGAIGDATAGDDASPQTLWVTTPGTTPPAINNDGAFGNDDTAISQIVADAFGAPYPTEGQTESPSATVVYSWNEETLSGAGVNDFINAYANPNVTGETSATVWQVPENGTPTALGTLTLNSSGTVTFNLISGVSAPVIQFPVVRSGNTTTISFTTVSGHVYTLYYTNSAGLLAPLSTWPTNTTTINGNGSIESLMDTYSGSTRFYKVGVH